MCSYKVWKHSAQKLQYLNIKNKHLSLSRMWKYREMFGNIFWAFKSSLPSHHAFIWELFGVFVLGPPALTMFLFLACSCGDHNCHHHGGSLCLSPAASSATQLPSSSIPRLPAHACPAPAGDASGSIPCTVPSPLPHAATRTPSLPWNCSR